MARIDNGNYIIEDTPDKLTPELQEQMCSWIRKGNMRKPSAIMSGISYQTFINWMASGELNPKSPCGTFRQAVLRAEADHQADLVAKWEKINEKTKDYRSLQALLERRHKNDWEPPVERQEISGPGGGAIKLGRADLEVLSMEELEAYEAIMAKLEQKQLAAKTLDTIGPGDGSEVIDVEFCTE